MKEKSYISRPIYFNKIKPFINTNLIKVLTGQRRVGKSFVLAQIIDEIKELDKQAVIIYINKEDYKFQHIKTHDDLMNHLKEYLSAKGNHYLFIDEVQDISGFELALRSLLSVNKWDIYITGSNATLLSGELATLLSGRYVQIPVHSLSYAEFLNFHNFSDSTEAFGKFIKWGGMPHIIHLEKNDSIIYEYLKNIHNTIVLKDVIIRFNVRNVRFLQDLIQYIADITGSLISAKRISDYLKSQQINISPKLVLEYLNYIASVYLIHRVKRTEISGRKVFEVGEKFYFEDFGMRNAILPFEQKYIGKALENIVYQHLLINNYSIHVGKQGNKEIDFVATRNDEKLYIQVAYLIPDEKTHEREFGNLLSIRDNYKKMVISMDPIISGNHKGIQHISVRNFLLNIH